MGIVCTSIFKSFNGERCEVLPRDFMMGEEPESPEMPPEDFAEALKGMINAVEVPRGEAKLVGSGSSDGHSRTEEGT